MDKIHIVDGKVGYGTFVNTAIMIQLIPYWGHPFHYSGTFSLLRSEFLPTCYSFLLSVTYIIQTSGHQQEVAL
jgi:hypothetical protein